MKLILSQPVDKITVEIPIVFSDVKLHVCLKGGRGDLGVMSDFSLIDIKFGMEAEYDILNDYPKFGCDELISCPVGARIKKFS